MLEKRFLASICGTYWPCILYSYPSFPVLFALLNGLPSNPMFLLCGRGMDYLCIGEALR